MSVRMRSQILRPLPVGQQCATCSSDCRSPFPPLILLSATSEPQTIDVERRSQKVDVQTHCVVPGASGRGKNLAHRNPETNETSLLGHRVSEQEQKRPTSSASGVLC